MSLTNRIAELTRSSRSRGDIVLLAALASVLLGIAVMLFLSSPPVTKALVLASTKQPEHFTELFITDPNNLPKQVISGRPAITSFRVINHENRAVLYHARISLVENGRIRVLSTSSFQLPDDGAITIPVTFATARPETNLELIIELPDQNESIHFRSKS